MTRNHVNYWLIQRSDTMPAVRHVFATTGAYSPFASDLYEAENDALVVRIERLTLSDARLMFGRRKVEAARQAALAR